VYFLTRPGVEASARFWADFVRELIRQRAPLDAVWAYQPWEEAYLLTDAAPFTWTSGSFTSANGQAYDMTSAADRARLLNDSFVYFIDQVRAAIRDVDPTALVGIGFFEPQTPNPSRRGDPRLVATQGAITRSTADFVDIHTAVGFELSLGQYMQNYGIAGTEPKPVVMGEFYAPASRFPTAAAAASALRDWVTESCRYGLDGWLLWTWDTDEQSDFWNAMSGGGAIEQALAPKNLAGPC